MPLRLFPLRTVTIQKNKRARENSINFRTALTFFFFLCVRFTGKSGCFGAAKWMWKSGNHREKHAIKLRFSVQQLMFVRNHIKSVKIICICNSTLIMFVKNFPHMLSHRSVRMCFTLFLFHRVCNGNSKKQGTHVARFVMPKSLFHLTVNTKQFGIHSKVYYGQSLWVG